MNRYFILEFFILASQATPPTVLVLKMREEQWQMWQCHSPLLLPIFILVLYRAKSLNPALAFSFDSKRALINILDPAFNEQFEQWLLKCDPEMSYVVDVTDLAIAE